MLYPTAMSKERRTAIIMASFTAFIWGLSFMSIKVAVAVIPPMSLGLIRFVIATAVLYAYLVVKKQKPTLAMKDLPLMAGAGLVGVTLYFLGENNGVLILSASESSIIIGTIPVLTILAERLFLRTPMSAGQYAGAALSAAGVGLMVAESLRVSARPMGYLYMGLAALSWIGYAFMTRPLFGTYSRLSITFWQSLFGALGFVPFAFTERVDWSALSAPVLGHVLFLGIFCSAVGYLFYITSMQVLGTSASSVFINLVPVVSVAAAWLFLGERLSSLQMLGAAVAVLGVYLAVLAVQKPSGKSLKN